MGSDLATLALPTRADEAFRYADLASLAPLWPIAPQVIHVPAGQSEALAITALGAGAEVRDIAITLEAGASFDLRVLNAGGAYGRIAVTATLGKGADRKSTRLNSSH